MNPIIRICALLLSTLPASFAFAADYPTATEGDYTIRDFKFTSGETLPELRLHYRTLGKPEKDADGKTTNAVLIMHGTTGSGAQFIRPEFAGELFGKDQPLDAIVIAAAFLDGADGEATGLSGTLRRSRTSSQLLAATIIAPARITTLSTATCEFFTSSSSCLG